MTGVEHLSNDPVVLDVFVLNHFTVNYNHVSTSVYLTYARALHAAVRTAHSFSNNLVLPREVVEELDMLASSPALYGRFLERYQNITHGDRFEIVAKKLEL